MTTDLPYMPAVGNVPAILQKIKSAGTPPKFTGEFVKTTLGFTASQDRSFPRMLKQLRFINADGVPLPRYNEFKAAATAGKAMADGLREGWAPVFMADQSAHSRSATELTDIFKTITGQSDSVAKKMASTFKAFAAHGDWSIEPDSVQDHPTVHRADEVLDENLLVESEKSGVRGSVNLHHDIHLHLPPTSDVSVYRAIFRALREELQ